MEFIDLIKKIYCGESVRSDAVNLSAAAVVARSLPRGLEVNSKTMQFERAVQNCARKKSTKRQKAKQAIQCLIHLRYTLYH